ncbi:MAG: hypothetical protein IJT32_02375 [Lachnospiraceae bacterium]|nr:hypothetical protein [Lachnospiraceae bacterium]
MNLILETLKEAAKMAASWSIRQKVVTGIATGAMTVSAVGGGMVGYQVTHQTKVKVAQTVPITAVEAAPAAAEPVPDEYTIEIPDIKEYIVTTSSMEKDLDIFFTDEGSGEKVTGVPFSVVLMASGTEAGVQPQADAVNAAGEQLAELKAAGFDDLLYEEAIAAEIDGILASGGDAAAKQSQLSALFAWEKAEEDTAVIWKNANTGEPVTVYDYYLAKKQEAVNAYGEALGALGGETYTDEDSDGEIHITDIDSGDYCALCVPQSGFDTAMYANPVSVKEKLEYKPVENIEQKVAASAPEAEKPAEAAVVEETFTDTVKIVESKKEETGDFEEAKTVTLQASKNGEKKTAKLSDGTGVYTIDSSKVTLYSSSDAAANSITIDTETIAPEGYEVGVISAKSSNTGALSVEGSGAHITLKAAEGIESHTEVNVTFNAKVKRPAGSEGSSVEKSDGNQADNGIAVTDANAAGSSGSNNEAASGSSGSASRTDASDGNGSASRTDAAAGNGNDSGADAAGSSASGTESGGDGAQNAGASDSSTGSQNAGASDSSTGSQGTDAGTSNGAGSETDTNSGGTDGTAPTARLYQKSGFRMMSEVSGDTSAAVTLTVVIIGTKEELKNADGDTLYVTEGDNAAAATIEDADKTLYRKSGEAVYYGWQTIEGKQYYFDENGKPVTGEQIIEGVKYTFGSDGAVIKSGHGVDVSKGQGDIDWSKLGPNVSFAIIRCAYRGSNGVLSIDPMYAKNMQEAKANGVKTGIYIYSTAMNELEAVEEASLAIMLANEQGGVSLPIYIDMENSAQGRLSKDELTAIANAFCVTVSGAGYRPGIYANYKWFTEKLNTGTLNASIWCARYNTVCGLPFKFDIWQYSQTGTMPGVKGHIDMNEGYF